MIRKGFSVKVACFLAALVAALGIFSVQVLADGYAPDWGTYASENGVTEFTYNKVVDAIESVMAEAVKAYNAGDAATALEIVKTAKNGYWGASGLKIAMQKELPSIHKGSVTADFTACNRVLKDGGSKEDFATAVDVLIADLRTSANKLDGIEVEYEIAEESETKATPYYNKQYYGTWEDYSNAAGITSWTWNDVADAMAEVFRTAKKHYAAGDVQSAYDCVNDGYYGFYETTGFERNTMGFISGARKSEVELQFSACKSVTKSGGTKEEFDKQVDILRTMICTDANKLDGVDENGNAAGGRSAEVATFIACFGIMLREGFEAILVVGAIIAYLVKSTEDEKRRKELVRPVYVGAIFGIVMSFISAWLLNAISLANSASQEIIEGVTALIAVVVLYYVSNWMISKSESEAWNRYIKTKVGNAHATGNTFALAFTAFLAVYREGAEVILFYQPLIAGDHKNMVWIGFIAGCICLVFVYLAIRFLSVKLPLKPFFIGTSILMFIMSISFLGSGIKELIEGDVLVAHSPAWVAWIPSNAFLEVLGIYPLVETIVPQLILLAITVVLFIFWMDRNRKLREEVEKMNEDQE